MVGDLKLLYGHSDDEGQGKHDERETEIMLRRTRSVPVVGQSSNGKAYGDRCIASVGVCR